ncbi:MAG: outer membrane protein assembly factor BamA [Lysobacteraceae bacterium]
MTRPNAPRMLALALASALAFSATAQGQSFDPFVVEDIRVDGLQRIAAGTVFSYLPVERGETLTRARSSEAIRALFRTGFFSDVRLERQGDILVVVVAERPAINQVNLVGNRDIRTEDLERALREIGLAAGETFDRLNLDRVTQELLRQYNNRGKYGVEITPRVTPLERNRVDITIDITEGRTSRIRHINIIGNETYDDDEIRRGWESNTSNWLSWYRRDDQYSREKLGGDLERLEAFYLNRGYIDFSIDTTQVEISPDRSDMFISASVTEGEVYTVADVELTGDTVLPREDVERLVLLQPGQTFSRALIELTSERIVSALSNIGYAFAEVQPIPEVDRDARTVSLRLFVNPGERVQVRRIQFRGNTRTADDVLRREMRQFENAWYSQAAIDRSKVRLQRLGYFEKVDIETPPVPGTSDQVDIIVQVEERQSGQFQFALGYSQLAGLITTVSLSQDNFLGTGNSVSVAVQNNVFQKRFDFTYVDPYFTEDGVSVGYNVRYSEFNSRDFNTARFNSDTGAIRAIFGIPLSETDQIGLSFGIDRNKIVPVPGFTPTEIEDYLNNVGNFTFKSWRSELFWARDSRNHFFVPTRGTVQRIGAEVTLPGSTQEYYKLSYQFSRYFPVSRALVINTSVNLGYGGTYGNATANGFPFFENFYAGGERSVRGFENNTLGPCAFSDFQPDFCQPLGGSVRTVGSTELIFPTLFDTDAVRVSAFLDYGNVFRSTGDVSFADMRASAGVAMQWQAPIGPIVISYGVPVRKEEGDRIERLQFSFGTTF